MILRLVDDGKAGLFHAQEILPAEFAVVADLTDLEAALPHGNEPFDHVGVVIGGRVAHIQPAVIPPAEKGDIVLVGLDAGGDDGEPAVREADVHVLIAAMERGGGEVVQLREVRAAVPFDGQLQDSVDFLIQRPVRIDAQLLARFRVGPAEGGYLEIGALLGGEDVQGLCEEILALLGIVGGLAGVVHDVRRADGDAIVGVGLLVLHGVEDVHIALLILVRAADEHEQVLVVILAAQHAAAVGQALGAEGCAVVARGRNGDDQLVGVGLGGLFEHVVLLGALVGVDLVGDDDIAVKRVLSIRIRGEGVEGDGAARQIGVADGVLE